jgi:hypothetical protein
MKKIFFIIVLFITFTISAQVQLNGGAGNQTAIVGSNVLIDGSSIYSSGPGSAGADAFVGKGVVIPSVDLVNFLFDLTLADGSTFPTYFDGMVVYNNATGTTLTAGNRSSTAAAVSPGFYYFSNPNGAVSGLVTGGVWRPIGGALGTLRSKTVSVTVAANPTLAELNLGTAVIAANEVLMYREAKIYNSAGNLVMTADGDYNRATNVVTTGSGMINQVLPAGTYTVVVAYN